MSRIEQMLVGLAKELADKNQMYEGALFQVMNILAQAPAYSNGAKAYHAAYKAIQEGGEGHVRQNRTHNG